jgi:hypothetical protein
MTGMRWWRHADIAGYSGTDLFSPRDIATPLAALIASDIPDAPDARSVTPSTLTGNQKDVAMNAENPVQIDLFGVSAIPAKDARLAGHSGGSRSVPALRRVAFARCRLG